MKNLNRIFLVTLFAIFAAYHAAANGDNTLGQIVRLSKQGLNYATATVRLGKRFSPAGIPQPAILTLSGIPKGAKIEAAYFWISTSGDGAPITMTFTNPGGFAATYPVSLIGSGADKCWDFPASLSYRADVTASIKDLTATEPKNANYNGNYFVSGLPTKMPEPDPPPPDLKKGTDVDGGTLMIIYTDPNANYIGNIIIYDGSVVKAPGFASQSISTINPINPLVDAIPSTGTPVNARAFMGAGDFQFASDVVSMNGGPAFFTTDWDWWNFYDRPTTITKGQSTSDFYVSSSNDCWNWTLMGVYYQTNELELIGLEVNQTIQDLDNSIPLIEKKPTIVRAFVQSNDATTKNIQPKLKVKRGTDSVYVTADNNAIFKAQPQTTSEADFIRKRVDKDPTKSLLYLNYQLPPDWRMGTVELSFEPGIDCKAVSSRSTNCKTTVTFNPSKAMDLKFYNSAWTNENGVKQTISDPTFKTNVTKLAEEIKSFYPVSTINVSYGKNSIGVYNFNAAISSGAPYRNLFIRNNSLLEALNYQNHPPEVNNYYLGLVYAAVQNDPQGRAISIPGVSATFHSQAVFSTIPHELGHLLGREHVPFCDASTSNPQGFPPEDVYMGKPSLGPTLNGGSQKRIYGYNSQTGKIVDPETNSELMSYCDPTWTSDFTYKALIPIINASFTNFAKKSNNTTSSIINKANLNNLVPEYRLVRGTINVDSNSTIFDPIVLLLTNNIPPSPPSGDYNLQLIDNIGNIIRTISFKPTLLYRENSTEPQLANFMIPVLWDSAINKVAIVKNNTVIAQKTASANYPTVHVLFPNGGEMLSGSTSTFTWDGNDLDGDQLTYVVQFSKDGGSTWETLDIDITDKSYEADLSFLGATNKGLIRILVSDGFNVAFDESDGPFQTPNSKPDAYIVKPATGDVFVGAQPIIFSAVAKDLEDGDLPDSALSWYSSLDGFLGNGANIYKPAATQLSEGDHTIYFKATDSFGDTTRDSIKITVQRILSAGTVYYSKSEGDLHNVLTWGINLDGSGENPTDFGSGKYFPVS